MRTEEIVIAVRDAFADALGAAIADDQDFFEAGGDSFAVEHVLVTVSARFGIDVPGWMLLDNPTVASFSEALRLLLASSEPASGRSLP